MDAFLVLSLDGSAHVYNGCGVILFRGNPEDARQRFPGVQEIEMRPEPPMVEWTRRMNAAEDRKRALPATSSSGLVEVVAGVIERSDGRMRVARRGEGRFAGCWEFPGGKVRPGEAHAGALVRELNEEGVIVGPAGVDEGPICTHDLREVGVRITHYRVGGTVAESPPPDGPHTEYRWVTLEELRQLSPVTSGMVSYLASLGSSEDS